MKIKMIKSIKILAENILILLKSEANRDIIKAKQVRRNDKMLIITEFLSASKPINHKNLSFYMNERRSSALIFPICGKLEFSWKDKVLTVDSEHPIFIPKGLCYKNVCIEDAQSFMFNIQVQDGGEDIIRLLPHDARQLQRIYDEITTLNAPPTTRKQSIIFSKLYQLIGECFPFESADETTLLSPALEMIEKGYHKCDLRLEHLAVCCNISKPFLHILFKKHFGMTPFQYITHIRMKQAKILLAEGYPVGVVSSMVGYSDVYQFSRAFKRFYKYSPSKITLQHP